MTGSKYPNKELWAIVEELIPLLPLEKQKDLSEMKRKIKNAKKSVIEFLNDVRHSPFDNLGGAWDFLKKNFLAPILTKKLSCPVAQ